MSGTFPSTCPILESLAGAAVTVENVSTGSWATAFGGTTSSGRRSGAGLGAGGVDEDCNGWGTVGLECELRSEGFTYSTGSPSFRECTGRICSSGEIFSASALAIVAGDLVRDAIVLPFLDRTIS